jgi:hypothetical protein
MSHTADQKTKLRVSVSFTDDQLIDALKDIFKHYGYDMAALTVKAKGEIAARLSEVAGHSPPWEWRYVHNFMAHNVKAGQEFKAAIAGLAAMIDDTPIELVQGRSVSVVAVGNIHPGTLVFGDSVKCAYTSCPIWFLPKSKRHRFHSIKCRELAGKEKNGKQEVRE